MGEIITLRVDRPTGSIEMQFTGDLSVFEIATRFRVFLLAMGYGENSVENVIPDACMDETLAHAGDAW